MYLIWFCFVFYVIEFVLWYFSYKDVIKLLRNILFILFFMLFLSVIYFVYK